MRVLAIGAHPDDIEFSCLGFLLRQKKLGAKIEEEDNKYTITADELQGANIYLDIANMFSNVNMLLQKT